MTTPESNHEVEKNSATLNSGASGALGAPASDNFQIPAKAKEHNIRVSPAVLDAAGKDGDALLVSLHTASAGLTQGEAELRARTTGPNEVAQERQRGWFLSLLIIIRNPLVILLAVLSSISFVTGDVRAGSVMAGMIVLSVTLRFLQEARAGAAAAKLKAMIHVTATVVRDGQARELPLCDLVPGDIINLSAGDMIPGDVRIISAKDLFVSQGTLTGESLPVEKFHDADPKPQNSPTELKNICFMGTSVQSGTATAVVVVTGVHTYLGSMASSITEEETPTSFDQGLSRYTWLMIQLMAIITLVQDRSFAE
jgi:Mg2+-importing ATPase